MSYSMKKARKNAFSKKEDERLIHLVESCGKKINWRTISLDMEGRTPRQCRERYTNYLDPRLVKTQWTQQEDDLIMKIYSLQGNKWQYITQFLDGRSASSVRNRCMYLIKQNSKAERFNNSSSIPSPSSNTSHAETESDDNSEVNIYSLIDSFEVPFNTIFGV